MTVKTLKPEYLQSTIKGETLKIKILLQRFFQILEG